jgi:hypothetical protein
MAGGVRFALPTKHGFREISSAPCFSTLPIVYLAINLPGNLRRIDLGYN